MRGLSLLDSERRGIGNEGRIFRFVLWHSITLGAIVGVIVLAYAYLFPRAIPHGLNFIR